MNTITLSATFTDEQVTEFAFAHGWSDMISEDDGTIIKNPESAVEFNTRLAKENLVRFLTAPTVKRIERAKNIEKMIEVQRMQNGLSQTVTGEVKSE